MGTTLAGSTLAVSLSLPADNQAAADFAGLAWIEGECALHGVPPIGTTTSPIEEDLVCVDTTVKVKGGKSFKDSPFTLSKIPNDLLQDALQSLSDSGTAVGAFRLTMPFESGARSIYFTGRVADFDLTDGGGKNDINKRSGAIWPASKPIEV